jgi:hypothetical protein
VYRGKAIPALQGKYVFADWAGKVFSLEKQGNKWQRQNLTLDGVEDLRVNSLGEDENGELYLLTQREVGGSSNTGIVYRITGDGGNQ